MERKIYLCWMVMWFCAGCQGLELTLSRDWSVGGRKGCGVILCEETYEESMKPTNFTFASSTSAKDDPAPSGDRIDSSGSIRKMQLFKHAQQATFSSRGRRGFVQQKRLVASLTPEQPSVSRVSDGVKVDGQLTAGKATLRLGLYKHDDCRAEFTCEVTRVDSQGNNHVTSSHLVQQEASQESRLWSGGAALGGSSGVTLTLISMLHEIDNKLVQIGLDSDDSWLSKVQALENRLEDKLETVGNRLENKIESMEDRLENKLENSGMRLGDEMASLKNDLLDGLEKFHDKLEDSINDRMKAVSSVLKSQSLDALKQQFKTTEDKIIVKVDSLNSNLQSNLKATTAAVASLQNELTSQQKANLSEVDCVRNIGETLQGISTACHESTRSLKGQLNVITQNLEQKFQQLSKDTTNSNDTTSPVCSKLHDLLSETQANVTENLQAAIMDTLTLKTCEKNVVSVLPLSFYPYPMVRPNSETPFDFPYLCDTFTDGGGWIVIQRRTTGGVDFFRTWDEYKNGFGFLNDDFWLGNEKIHAITHLATYELRITLKYKGTTKYAHYSSFSLSNERSNYTLHLGTFDGTAPDSLTNHKGQQFSTKDRKNDANKTTNCALAFLGGWWYKLKPCHISNLNGKWGERGYKGPSWNGWTAGEPTTFTEMKIRKVDGS